MLFNRMGGGHRPKSVLLETQARGGGTGACSAFSPHSERLLQERSFQSFPESQQRLASLAEYTPAPGPHSGRGCLGPRWSQDHSAMGSQEAGVPMLPDLLGAPLISLTGQPPSLPSWWRWRRGPGARPPPSLGGSAQLGLDSLHPSPARPAPPSSYPASSGTHSPPRSNRLHSQRGRVEP